MLLELFVAAAIHATCLALFAPFMWREPLWKRLAKVVVALGLVATISHFAGTTEAFILIGAVVASALTAHFWWLHRHGIHPITAEPLERYYALRGWTFEEHP